MIYTAIAFFSLAAILGMFLLTFVLRGKETPKAVVFTHGPLAATGLVILLFYAFGNSPSPTESVVLFVLAAISGIMMVYKDLTGKKVPKGLAIGHGVLAVAGFVFLLIFAFR